MFPARFRASTACAWEAFTQSASFTDSIASFILWYKMIFAQLSPMLSTLFNSFCSKNFDAHLEYTSFLWESKPSVLSWNIYSSSCLVWTTKTITFITDQRKKYPLVTTQKIMVYLSLPSWAAAPPSIIFVIYILGSLPMWGLSVPPAILNPRPALPCTSNGLFLFSFVFMCKYQPLTLKITQFIRLFTLCYLC